MSLIIRREQMDTMGWAIMQQHAPTISAHVREHFREQMQDLSDAQLRGAVELAMRRGWDFGVRIPSVQCQFVDLDLLFGAGFQHDRKWPWTGDPVPDDRAGSADQAIRDMTARAIAWLRQHDGVAPAAAAVPA